MQVEIFVVGPDSATLMECVAEDVFDHPIRADWLQAYLAHPDHVLVVARANDQVVGMATGLAYLHPDKPMALFINEVGVAPEWQGQGIGKRLMARVLDWGKEKGCAEAWVATEASNSHAQNLYRSAEGIADEEAAIVFVFPLGGGDLCSSVKP